jgi:hypothetical protein
LADLTSSLYSCSLSVLLYLHFSFFILSQMYDGFVNLFIPSQKVFQFSCLISLFIFYANRHPSVFQKCLFSFTVVPFKQFSVSDSNYLIAFSISPYTLWLFSSISSFSLYSISVGFFFLFPFRSGLF